MALVYDDTLLREPGLYVPGRKPVGPVRLNPDHWQARGLVGYWPFLGDFRDYSGNGNHGTNNGATWVGSSRGRVLDFPGTGEFVDFGQDPTGVSRGESGDDITIAMWLRADVLTGENVKGVLSHLDALNDPDENWSLRLESIYDESAGPYVWFRTFGGNNGGGSEALAFVGVWVHIVAVWRPGTDISIYADGRLSSTVSESDTSDDSGVLRLGTARLDMGDSFNGKIDDFRIYNRALSAREVRGIYRDPYALLTDA